jgi:hypothetical protein
MAARIDIRCTLGMIRIADTVDILLQTILSYEFMSGCGASWHHLTSLFSPIRATQFTSSYLTLLCTALKVTGPVDPAIGAANCQHLTFQVHRILPFSRTKTPLFPSSGVHQAPIGVMSEIQRWTVNEVRILRMQFAVFFLISCLFLGPFF